MNDNAIYLSGNFCSFLSIRILCIGSIGFPGPLIFDSVTDMPSARFRKLFSRKRLLSLGAILVLVGLVVLVSSNPLSADSVGDKVDDARIKARAGNVNEALDDLDVLAEEHPDDPRVHYYRSKFLRDLERRNDAADALEAAADALKKYKAKGGKDKDILALEEAIQTDSEDLLKYRSQAREILADYRNKALPLIRKLIKEGKPREASYALDELSAAMGEEDAELQELRKEIETAIRKEK